MKLSRSANRLDRLSPRTAAIGLLALAAVTGQSYGQVLKIGVSFDGRNASPVTFGIDQFAGVDPQQDWNFLGAPFDFPVNPGPQSSGPLLFDNGLLGSSGVSNITVTASANDSWNSDGGTATPDQQLMKGIIKAAFTANQVGTVTINGLLTGASYKLIAYTQMNGGSASASDWSLSGNSTYDTYFIQASNNFDGNFTRGTSTDGGSRTAGVDYVQWDSVQANASGSLTLNWTWRSGQDGAGLAGFQLIQLANPQNRNWEVGAGTGVWDLTTSTNWLDVADTPGAFIDFDNAIFGNRGTAGARTVQVAPGGVTASAITVANSAANPYTIGGGGPIKGPAKLTKTGVGELTMVGENEFTGGVDLKHGTLNAATVGDSTAPGALGKSGLISIGDTTGANDAVFNYTGTSAAYDRNVAILGNGGTVAVPAGQTLILSNLSGDGPLTKGGGGGLNFIGNTGAFTGTLNVPQGALSVARLGSGTGKTLNLGSAGAATLGYSGGSLDDARSLTVGAGGATISVTNPNALYRLRTGTATAGGLTVSGQGRLSFKETVNFAAMPTISAGATLALQAEAGNTLPAGPITVSSGILEIAAPGTIGDSTPLVLSGGTIRLGHEGLLGQYFSGDLGDIQNDMSGTARNISSYFAGLGVPETAARTTTNGRTDLNFSNNFSAAAPFADQGHLSDTNIRAYFSGKILVTQSGLHTFYTRSDDGSVLFIDGRRVVNNNAFQGQTERSGSIELTPGLHDIQIIYYEGGGDAGLNIEYTPAGGSRQVIPNTVLFAGDVYESQATQVTVTANSTLQVAAGHANLGTLNQTTGTILTVDGSANFAGGAPAAGTYGIHTATQMSHVNLGPIGGSGARVVNKTGPGALVFNQTATPVGLTVNVNEGLIINLGSETFDALAGIAVNYGASGGLGLDSSFGNPVYTTPSGVNNDFRLEAGGFGGQPGTTQITYAPSNGLNIASGKTLTIATNIRNLTLDITPAISGSGAVVVEQGRVNLNSTVNAPGGFTVHTGQVTTSSPMTVGALTLTNNFNGVSPTGATLSGFLNVQNSVNAGSVNVSGGTLTVRDDLIVTGVYAQSGGSANLNSALNTGSMTLTGGGITVTGNLTSSGSMNVGGNAIANLNANVNVASLSLTGSANVTILGNLTAPGGSTVGQGAILSLGNFVGSSASGNITVNGGTVRATGGVTDLGNHSLIVTPRTFTPGLLEGFFANTTAVSTEPNTGLGRPGTDTGGIRLSPRMGLTAQKDAVNPGNYWGENETWVYTGQFFDADGIFTFAENIDDAVRVIIDGVTVLSNGQWQTATSTQSTDGTTTVAVTEGGVTYAAGDPRSNSNSGTIRDTNDFGMGSSGDGWHTFEVRFQGGGGGNGTVNGVGWGGGDNASYTNKGFGLNVNGTTSRAGGDFVMPIDPGDGSLFRFVTPGTGGTLSIDSGSTIAAASITGAEVVTMTGFAGFGSTLKLHDNAALTLSSTDEIRLTGFIPFATLDIGANNKLTVGKLNLPEDAELVKQGPGSVVISGSVTGNPGAEPSNFTTGTVRVIAGELVFNATGRGSGRVEVTGSGRLSGTGVIPKLTVHNGGGLAPGASAGVLTVGRSGDPVGQLELLAGGKLQLELQNTTTLDQIRVFGGVTLDGATLEGTLLGGFAAQINDLFFIIINDGTDPIMNLAGSGPGVFASLPNNSSVTFGGQPFQISYFGDSATNSFTGGNDVVLMAIPEPGTVSALLGGVATLLGLQRFRRRS